VYVNIHIIIYIVLTDTHLFYPEHGGSKCLLPISFTLKRECKCLFETLVPNLSAM